MKKIVFIFIFSVTVVKVYSQKHITKTSLSMLEKSEKDNPMLQDDDDFKNNNVSDNKWQNESAIIVSQKTTFSFDKQGVSAGKVVGRNLLGILFAPVTLGSSIYFANANNKNQILVQEDERRKILLRDNYAIDQYSVLYFRLAREGDAFAARVIKKNGAVQNIDPADAIAVSDYSSIPDIYTSYTDPGFSGYYRPSYYKIPIADLEPGDIIEYEFTHLNTQTYNHNPDYKEFEPVYYLCNREMPVAKQTIEVISENDNYYIAYKSLKGAPAFSVLTKGGKKIYRWDDENFREKNTTTSYVNQYLEMPSVKFQVLYARNNSKEFLWFNNEDAMKHDLSADALANQSKILWFHPGKVVSTGSYMVGVDGNIDDNVKAFYKLLKKRGVTDGTDDDYVQKAYYTIRSMTMADSWGDYAFAKIFSGLLDEKKIDHEIVVTPYNTRTDIADLAFSNELAWAIKYKNKYYVNPYDNYNPGEIPYYLSGNDCIIFPCNTEKGLYTKSTLPVSSADDNTLTVNIKASFDPAKKSNIVIDRTTDARNLAKNNIINDALAYTPYIETDYKNYGAESMWDGLDERTTENRSQDFNKRKKEWKEKDKPDYMKSLAESDLGFEVGSYDNFQLQSDGRSFKKQNLVYNEKFTLNNVSSFAGDDILLDLPALIGGQTRIKKEEQKQRDYPIDVRYARKFTWHIEMPIPSGYKAAGLENLNKTVSNNCGDFISIAKVDNNNLVIDVTKKYKAPQFESKDWQELLDMLNTAYDFSQSKVVLIKQ